MGQTVAAEPSLFFHVLFVLKVAAGGSFILDVNPPKNVVNKLKEAD